MTMLNNINKYGEEIEKRLRLKTSPIAIKLLEKEEDIPEEAVRPKRDLGVHLSLCQAFAKSRREGATVAMLKEDNWCWAPVIAFGLAVPPDFFLEGNMYYPMRVADPEAAKYLAKTFPRLECGQYIGVVSAPLETANFIPQTVVIYCNSAQLRCLLEGIKYRHGYQVTSTLEPGGACVQSTVPVIQSNECQVTVPCGGDRRHALAQDDEMIFSLSRDELENLVLGLRHFDEIGFGCTSVYPDMMPEYPLLGSYVKLSKIIGLDIH
jgi:uncharacterized protein (DUF169 family)